MSGTHRTKRLSRSRPDLAAVKAVKIGGAVRTLGIQFVEEAVQPKRWVLHPTKGWRRA